MNAADVLNKALEKDPNAIHAIIFNRVPCNESLADDEFVRVILAPTSSLISYQVGALGLINAVLAAHNLPIIYVELSDGVDQHGRKQILEFLQK